MIHTITITMYDSAWQVTTNNTEGDVDVRYVDNLSDAKSIISEIRDEQGENLTQSQWENDYDPPWTPDQGLHGLTKGGF